MAPKHNIRDADNHFIVNAETRKITRESTAKIYLMQYDHNSEEFTFDVPLKIENHDMSQCDVVEIHYENTSTGTSTSNRKTYRGKDIVEKDKITIGEDAISFGWLITDKATQFAGSLKFQLKFICYENNSAWQSKTWKGLTYFTGNNVWRDGAHTYYSNGDNHYILEGDTWIPKTWDGLTTIYGSKIWNHNGEVYYSDGSQQYTFTGYDWTPVTWTGLTTFNGDNIWSDGNNTYYSSGDNQYILNGYEWTSKTWSGLESFNGNDIWTDGINTYYSSGTDHYFLAGSTWISKTWSDLTDFNGADVWTDGVNMYYSTEDNEYILNDSGWKTLTITGTTPSNGSYIWTDGVHTYYSYNSIQYLFAGPSGVEGYKWHTDVNEDISIKAGLSYETTGNDNVTVDPELNNYESNENKVRVINDKSTHIQYPSAKAVYEFVNGLKVDTITNTAANNKYPSAKAVYDFVDTSIKSSITTALNTEVEV